MKSKILALVMAMLFSVFCFAAMAEDDSEWAALFTDNTWVTESETTSSSSSSQTTANDDATNAFWEALTSESSASSNTSATTSSNTTSSASSTASSSANRSTASTSRVGELGDNSASLSLLFAFAALSLITALFARNRRTTQR